MTDNSQGTVYRRAQATAATLALWAIGLFLLPGCSGVRGHACHQMGCNTNYYFHLSRKSAWQPGDYLLAVDTDSDGCQCQFSVPLAPDRPLSCGNCKLDISIDASSTAMQLTFLVPDLGSSKHVGIALRSGDREVAKKALAVRYDRSEINGPGCGTCDYAKHDTFDVP